MIEEIQQQITNLYMVRIDALDKQDYKKALEATRMILEAEKALSGMMKVNAYLIEELWPNAQGGE